METKLPLFAELAKSEIIQFEYYAIFLRNDNIVQIHMQNNFECELEDSQRILECIKQVSKEKKYPLLAIYSDFNSFSKEAKDFVSVSTATVADALVGNGVAFKIIGNFYLRINKPIRPTRLFNDVESALQWLKQFHAE